MHVLLTCAGRRNYLVGYFQSALQGKGLVIAVDSNIEAPALQAADRALLVPPITQENYIDALVSICQEYQVKLLVPSHDLELPLIATQRQRFLDVGTIPLISSANVIETCFDKLATSKFLANCGLAVPRTYSTLSEAKTAIRNKQLMFPVVIKPRWGTSSIEMQYAADQEELELTYQLVRKRLSQSCLAQISATDPQRCILIQEKLHGDEYGLDIVNNFAQQYQCSFVKHKLRMRAGQTDRAVTVNSEPLAKIGEIIGKNLGHVGNLDCDIFVTPDNYYVLDLNPRIGYGYPYSHIAGANLPAALVAWAAGEEPLDDEWQSIQPNIMVARYDSLITIKSASHILTEVIPASILPSS